jgi:hypothetical protein
MDLKLSDGIALASAIIALVSLVVATYAIRATDRIATSGFQAAQRVKSDTAMLLAALRGIEIKGALYTQQDPKLRDSKSYPDHVDLRPEKESIERFLNSPTAVGYYLFVARRSEAAGGKPEEWRTFFLRLGEIAETDNPYDAALQAMKVEKMFDAVSKRDIDDMSAGLEDLPGAATAILKGRPHDPVIQALSAISGARTAQRQRFPAFVKFLREQGVNDPDVDMFFAVTSHDANLLKDALHRGAKPSTTDGEIIQRYHDLWEKFAKGQPGSQGEPAH